MSNAHTPHPDFVTDQNGKRKAVILSLEHYQELLDDLDDLAVVAERQSEETISQAELERELERDTKWALTKYTCGRKFKSLP